jgi:hypothetical protein
MTLPGPWIVRFPPNFGAPAEVVFARLISWPEHDSPGIKFFSGTATYTSLFVASASAAEPGHCGFLNLGNVQVIASVRVNGKDCGIGWKPPYEIEVTEALRPGTNTLEVRVANLWPNRLIGDEQLPEDCLWREPTPGDAALAEWPQWLASGQTRPTSRIAFTTWKYWRKDSPLQPSGLLGPVTLRWARRSRVD